MYNLGSIELGVYTVRNAGNGERDGGVVDQVGSHALVAPSPDLGLGAYGEEGKWRRRRDECGALL